MRNTKPQNAKDHTGSAADDWYAFCFTLCDWISRESEGLANDILKYAIVFFLLVSMF